MQKHEMIHETDGFTKKFDGLMIWVLTDSLQSPRYQRLAVDVLQGDAFHQIHV